MLALDIDGTIADRNYKVPEPTVAAIRDAVSAGVLVSLVTGRMRRSALRFAETCSTNGPTASYQGAIITGPDRVTDTHIEPVVSEVVLSAIATMREASVHINVYADDHIWVENEAQWALEYASRMKTDLKIVDSLDEITVKDTVVVMGVDDPDQISSLTAQLRNHLGSSAAVTHSLPRFCEVASPRATKAEALVKICSDYSIKQSEVIAIGDGEGDISMLKWAGLGVSSGSAGLAVRKAADLHIPGPEESGVADLTRSLLKQGKLGG